MALSVSVPEAEAAVSGMNEQVYMAPFMVIVMCLMVKRLMVALVLNFQDIHGHRLHYDA